MITKQKIVELKERMLNHKVDNDVAIVKLTALELQDLIRAAEEYLDYNSSKKELYGT